MSYKLIALNKLQIYLASLLVLCFFTQAFWGSLEKSLVVDEPIFIATGYSYLIRSDFSMDIGTPPLLQELVAFPLLFMDIDLPAEKAPPWYRNHPAGFAYSIFDGNFDKLLLISFWSRLPVILLGTGLVAAIYLWGKGLWGPGTALVGTAAAAFEPNLLAHAQLATTDLGCSALMFVSVWSFWQALRLNKIRNWLLCGGMTGLALLTKYTALLLGPIFIVIGVILLVRQPNLVLMRTLGKGALLVGVIVLVVISVGYDLSFSPERYLRGLKNIYSFDHRSYYLLGQVSEEPWWYYHVLAFLMKVPVSTLLLIVVSIYCLARAKNSEALIFLLVPALIIIGASCFDERNIGLRRILPAFPFLLLLASGVIAGELSYLRLWLAVGLICWSVFEAATIYPHHLAYFNVFAGGPEKAPYLLDDSNIDWGQDLPALAKWQKKNKNTADMKIIYFGGWGVNPSAYGVKAERLNIKDIWPPRHLEGIYAVSVHLLVSMRKSNWAVLKKIGYSKSVYDTLKGSDWLSTYTPIGRAGHSIYIYRFPPG